jgi:hypothetical protein
MSECDTVIRGRHRDQCQGDFDRPDIGGEASTAGMKRFGGSVGRQARALPRAPFGLRGLSLAAASKQGPPCDRRLAVASLAHRFGRVERFARFQNPEAEDQNARDVSPLDGRQSRAKNGPLRARPRPNSLPLGIVLQSKSKSTGFISCGSALF